MRIEEDAGRTQVYDPRDVRAMAALAPGAKSMSRQERPIERVLTVPARTAALRLAGAHLLTWAAVLGARMLHGAGGSLDWNPFPVETLWHRAYAILNAPVYLVYEPIESYFFHHFRMGVYDLIPPSSLERVVSHAYHLAGFALWWYILGWAAVSATQRLKRPSAAVVG
jgi:hypothetical protein